MNPGVKCALVGALFATSLLSPAPALGQVGEPAGGGAGEGPWDAEKAERARALMREGLAEWGKDNLEGARDALARAWQVSPNPNVASALGELDMKLGRYREAADYWEAYLARLPPDHDSAAARLEECRRNLGKLRIHVEPAGATVTLDGDVMRRLKLGTDVWVDAGAHTLEAELHGRTTTQQVSLAPGGATEVSLTLPAEEREAVLTAHPGEPPTAQRSALDGQGDGVPARTIALVGGAVLTVAAATVGVVYTVKANRASNQVAHFDALLQAKAEEMAIPPHEVCSSPPGLRPSECTDLENAFNERHRAKNVAITSYIAAGALAAGTLATHFLWPVSKRSANLSVGPMLVGARGAQLSVSF